MHMNVLLFSIYYLAKSFVLHMTWEFFQRYITVLYFAKPDQHALAVSSTGLRNM